MKSLRLTQPWNRLITLRTSNLSFEQFPKQPKLQDDRFWFILLDGTCHAMKAPQQVLDSSAVRRREH